MSPDFLRALRDGASYAFMADIEHPDGDAHVWSGIGTLEYGRGDEDVLVPPQGSSSISASTRIALHEALPTGGYVERISAYSTVPANLSVKIARRNTATNFDIVFSAPLQHLGGGWQSAEVGFLVPGGADYFGALYTPAITAESTPAIQRGFLGGDVTGNGTFAVGVDTIRPFRVEMRKTYVYTGLGLLAGITTAPRTLEVRVDSVVLKLSGVDPQILDTISYEIRDRTANTWLVVLDDWNKPIGRMLIDNMLLDYMQDVVDDSGTATVELHAEAGFWTLVTPTRRAWSPTDQKLLYPNDTGMDYVPLMENKETKWTPT